MFYFKIVPVKMLPFDNKPEFNVVVNLPEGTALPVTANLTDRLVNELQQMPEMGAFFALIDVTAYQAAQLAPAG